MVNKWLKTMMIRMDNNFFKNIYVNVCIQTIYFINMLQMNNKKFVSYEMQYVLKISI